MSAWSKRFKVWAATRFTFLFPDNWLEPEERPAKKSRFRHRPPGG